MMDKPGYISSFCGKIFFWFLGILITAGQVFGQSPYFKPMMIHEDIRQDAFNCIFQDKSGLIWIGTDQAVFTFDGNRYNKVPIPDSCDGVGITAIFQDALLQYWFGFDNGTVLVYDGYDTFSSPGPGNDSGSRITSFLESEEGTVWMGTYGNGVILFKDDSVIQLNTGSGLSDDFIYSMTLDRDGRIWLGTDNGINICGPGNDLQDIEHISTDDGLPDFIVQSLVTDDQGNIWVGMHDHGVCCFDLVKDSFVLPDELKEWPYGPVNSLIAMDDRLWIATQGEGIIEYPFDGSSLEVYKKCDQYTLNRVRAFLKDQEENIWLITKTEICLSFGGKIEFLQSYYDQPIRNIHALTVDQRDHVWFANDQGLFRYHPREQYEGTKLKKYTLQMDEGSQKIMSLYHDVYGYLWIGTFGQGVFRMDPETGQHILITPGDGLVNGNILSISGNENEIWFGTLGGASRCKLDDRFKKLAFIPNFDNFGQEEGLVNNYIYQVHLSDDGTPYFATDGNGIFFLENDQFINVTDTDEDAKNIVYSVTTDHLGNTWMNIANEGLQKYDRHNVSKATKDPDHKNQTFSGIINVGDELIMAYEEGIDVLNITTGAIRHFEQNAGMVDIDPDLNTIARDSKNNVWIGSARGLIKYRPSGGNAWEQPVTRLNEVALYLNRINHRVKDDFAYDENHLSFSFSGLWYQYPERIEYLFKLEGHDIDWIKTRNHQVIYSDLKPGKYIFRVRAGIYDNYSGSNEATYSFEIKKAFYQTFWFILCILLSTIALIAIIFRIRTRQIKRKEEIIQDKIRFQFENLKSQLNPHFLFNSFSTLIALIEDNSVSAVKYVEELSNLFRNVLEFKDRDLITLNKEIRIAENYIHLQQKRFGEGLIIEITKTETFNTLQIPPLTLQLLIENAIKHNIVSREKPLSIKIFADQEASSIFVENNIQIKQEAAASMGIGIENIINRYKILTDKKVVITTTDKVFSVGLPFIP